MLSVMLGRNVMSPNIDILGLESNDSSVRRTSRIIYNLELQNIRPDRVDRRYRPAHAKAAPMHGYHPKR
jgi:hypothetical protein